jgi:putative acetyltransferase
MFIRDETESDREAICELQRRAFDGPGEAKLVDELRQSGAMAISLVAEQGERIVGHILFSKLEASTPRMGAALVPPLRALALAPIGVDPGLQRQGIGSALIRKGLERAREEGWAAIFVLGEPAYYRRFGFSVEAAKGYPSPYSGEHYMMLSLACKPIPTAGQIVYPAPFKRLD